MKQITKQPRLSKKAKSELAAHQIDVKVGDTLMGIGSSHGAGDLYKVSKITAQGIEILHQWWNDGELHWSHYGTIDFDRFHKEYAVLDVPYEEIEAKAIKAMEDLSVFEETIPEESDCTDLARPASKHAIVQAIGLVEAKRREMMMIQAVLDRKRNYLSNLLSDQKEKLEKMQKVLMTIELYLGIYEDIIILREGEPAPHDTPISIRQKLLFMDEEIAILEKGGMDAMDLEEFDKWILKDNHLDVLLPEPKGIVALRVRRNDKKYGDIWTQIAMDAENARTYFLIRNGEQVFRIWAGLIIKPRLFPLKNEFAEYFKDPDSLGYFEQRDAEEKEFTYKQAIVVLQGLIDRTEVFHPLGNERLNLMDPRTWNGRLNLIYDDELALPSGRLPWNQWKKKINGEIKTGSHVVWGGTKYSMSSEDQKYHCAYTHVASPSKGVYQVMGRRHGPHYYCGEMWYFLYNPGDTIWARTYYDESHDRTRRIAWYFHDDGNILNYDQMDLEDIEYYLQSRVDRPHYLDMLPLLLTLKKWREEELEREKLFVKLVVNRTKADEEKVWEAVDWWKHKNKWKRPIDKDDAKALRMIEKHLAK